MKIVQIKTHESVLFGKTQQQNFYSYNVTARRSGVEMKLLKDISCIELKSAEDHVLVPIVNIAFIKLDNEAHVAKQESKAKEAAKPKSNLKPSDLKKPK